MAMTSTKTMFFFGRYGIVEYHWGMYSKAPLCCNHVTVTTPTLNFPEVVPAFEFVDPLGQGWLQVVPARDRANVNTFFDVLARNYHCGACKHVSLITYPIVSSVVGVSPCKTIGCLPCFVV